jgi:hypothetical protein
MKERVYRDPVHGSIPFDRDDEAYIIELIDTAEFQRLRRIKQLGAAFLVFHGAEHTRFTHSIGVAHLAKKMLRKLESDPHLPRDLPFDQTKKQVMAGALLHDIGHGPFSHLFERVFEHKKHEEWGMEIIDSQNTEVHSVLQKHNLVDSVKEVLQPRFRPRFPRDIISSQLDADRLDYLLRDSYMTGVAYGRYDLDWLLGVIELARIPANGKDLGLAINLAKGQHVAEQFVIGRHLMYQQVYFHKTIRSAELMVKLVFERLRRNAAKNTYPKYCPPPLRCLIDPDLRKMNLDAYLKLDDAFMLTCFNVWSNEEGEDDVLKDIAKRLIKRNLFKTALIDTSKNKDTVKFARAMQKLNTAISEAGFDPDYYLASDTAEDLPYKDMSWYVSKEKRPEDIWLAENGEGKKTLSDVSPLIASIINEAMTTSRICFPKELRTIVFQHLHAYLSEHPGSASVDEPALDTSAIPAEKTPKPSH